MESDESYELNGEDMKRLVGEDVGILTYPNIKKFPSIEAIFEKFPRGIIILYLQQKDSSGASGHWSALLPIYKRRALAGAEFFCSYGILPDSALNWVDPVTNKRLGQGANYLSKLLLNFQERGGKVEFNEKRFQERNADIATCGRWAGLRTRYGDIPLKRFQNSMLAYRKKGHNLDELVTELTNNMLDF